MEAEPWFMLHSRRLDGSLTHGVVFHGRLAFSSHPFPDRKPELRTVYGQSGIFFTLPAAWQSAHQPPVLPLLRAHSRRRGPDLSLRI